MNAFRAPNVKGPRFKATSYDVLNKETYKKFIEKYPEYANVSEATFRKVIKEFNQSLWRTALDERDGIELPQSMGHLYIASCEASTKENVDYNKSAKLGFKVFHRNLSTDGKIAKVFYSNHSNRFNFANKNLWAFRAGRIFSRTLTKEYPEKWHTFVLKEKFRKGEVLKKSKRKIYLKEKSKESATEDYNEFNMD